MKQLLLALVTLSLAACATHVFIPGVPLQANPPPQTFHAACATARLAAAARGDSGQLAAATIEAAAHYPCLRTTRLEVK